VTSTRRTVASVDAATTLAGLTGWGGGIDERPREEGFFANLSPPIFGKTEVTRELD
jgi:hypothetical protein